MQADAAEARLARLEAQVRGLRLAVLGLAAVAVALGVWASRLDAAAARDRAADEAPRAVEAPSAPRELTVQDAEGRVRARLGVDGQGAAFLELSGPGPSGGARLSAAESGAGLELRDGAARRVGLGWAADAGGADRATLELLDRAGVRRAELVASDAVPALTLYNEHGNPAAGVP